MHATNCILFFLVLLDSGTALQCSDRACSPPMGNLATGRKLHTLTSCCGGPLPLCSASHRPCLVSHPPGHMADDPFMHPRTWWASDAGVGEEEIRLDLEALFCLTHLVMLFHSPRPAAMMLERSQDFAQTWEPLKLFARNCSQTFGLPDDVSEPGAPCTSRYSRATPCTEGEVIFRALGPGSGVDDPYSPEALTLLTLSNLRIRLLGAQSCPSPASPNHPSSSPIPPNLSGPSSTSQAASFAIYTLRAGGTCLCHGHAERCLPLTVRSDAVHQGDMPVESTPRCLVSSRDSYQFMSTCSKEDSTLPVEIVFRYKHQVQGRCVCLHHTAGEHCEKCAPLYNDQLWRPANGSSGEAHPCQKCECHGHADTCHFSMRAWQSSGGTSGGTCDNCHHNTEGRRCQRCRPGYHRRPPTPQNSPHACTRCWCDPVGTLPVRGRGEGRGAWCHPRSGHCQCRPGVGGTSCSHCLPGHWGFEEEGCKPCACPQNCDSITGHCQDSEHREVIFDIPVGRKIPNIAHSLTNENERVWSEKLAVSALHYAGKCSCKEKTFRSVVDLCKMKYAYVIKATVMSAHDKGSHAEVEVKVRKVLRSGQVPLLQGTHTLYPLSWTSRGCTCPILNPGVDYLLAGPEDAESGRLLVTMQSMVVHWTPGLADRVTKGLRQGCP